MRFIILSLILLCGLSVGAIAEEKMSAAEKAEKAEQVKADNPHIQVMNEKAKELASSLTEEEAKALGYIRENFGILRSIDVARKSVKEAVNLCAEKNPDMKDDIMARHDKWHGDIGAVLDKQEASLDKSINKQTFENPKDVRDFLDSIDDAAEYADGQLEKTIVTTPEACKNLMASMDDTQDVILTLITDMPWPDDKEAASGDDKN